METAINKIEKLAKPTSTVKETPETHLLSINTSFYNSDYVFNSLYASLHSIRTKQKLHKDDFAVGIGGEEKNVYACRDAPLYFSFKGNYQISLYLGHRREKNREKEEVKSRCLVSLQIYHREPKNKEDECHISIRLHGNTFYITTNHRLKTVLDRVYNVLNAITEKNIKFNREAPKKKENGKPNAAYIEESIFKEEVTIRYDERYEKEISETIQKKAQPDKTLNKFMTRQDYGDSGIRLIRAPVKINDEWCSIKSYRKRNYNSPALFHSDQPKLEIGQYFKRGDEPLGEFENNYKKAKRLIKGLINEIEMKKTEILPLDEKDQVSWGHKEDLEPLTLKDRDNGTLEFTTQKSQPTRELLKDLIEEKKRKLKKYNPRLQALEGVRRLLKRLKEKKPVLAQQLKHFLKESYNTNGVTSRFLKSIKLEKIEFSRYDDFYIKEGLKDQLIKFASGFSKYGIDRKKIRALTHDNKKTIREWHRTVKPPPRMD